MKKRPKLDPMSVLLSIRETRTAPKMPAPLASVPPEEISAFQTLRVIMEPSKLLQYLDKKEPTGNGERVVCINEDLVNRHYPGLDPLTDRLPGIDAFIYVYDGITGHDLQPRRAKGDLRPFLGEVGFREMLLELDKACKIHRFCCDNLRLDRIVVEPLTKKPTTDARRQAFAIPARAKEVFQRIADRLQREMSAIGLDTPQAYCDAYQFSCDMKQALEPLARIGKHVRFADQSQVG